MLRYHVSHKSSPGCKKTALKHDEKEEKRSNDERRIGRKLLVTVDVSFAENGNKDARQALFI